MAVSGVCSGVPEENSRKAPEKLLERFPRMAKCYKFWDLGAPGKANLPGTLGRHCLDLVRTFRAGCFFEIDSHSLLELF